MGRTNYSVAIFPPNNAEGVLDTEAVARIASEIVYDDNDLYGSRKVWSKAELSALFTGLEDGSLPEFTRIRANESNISEIRAQLASNILAINNSLTTNVNAINNAITALDSGIASRFIGTTLAVGDIAIGNYALSEHNGELAIRRNGANTETVITSDQFNIGGKYKLMQNADDNLTIKSAVDNAEMFTLVRQPVGDD